MAGGGQRGKRPTPAKLAPRAAPAGFPPATTRHDPLSLPPSLDLERTPVEYPQCVLPLARSRVRACQEVGADLTSFPRPQNRRISPLRRTTLLALPSAAGRPTDLPPGQPSCSGEFCLLRPVVRAGRRAGLRWGAAKEARRGLPAGGPSPHLLASFRRTRRPRLPRPVPLPRAPEMARIMATDPSVSSAAFSASLKSSFLPFCSTEMAVDNEVRPSLDLPAGRRLGLTTRLALLLDLPSSTSTETRTSTARMRRPPTARCVSCVRPLPSPLLTHALAHPTHPP